MTWKRRVSEIDVQFRGVVGDGQIDNAQALISLRDHMRFDRSRQYILNFPPGHYKYSNNRWLWGVGDVIIEGNNATFECISTSSWHANQRPFNTHDIFDADGDVPEGPVKTYENGYRFQDAAIGDSQIVLETSAEAANFVVGEHALLYGFNQQDGLSFPPNARYFEWVRIVSVDTGTGALGLERRLSNAYKSDGWQDTLMVIDGGDLYIGHARILKLERDNFQYARYIELRDIVFAQNSQGGPDDLTLAADILVCHRVRAAGQVVPSENRIAIYEDCEFGSAEPDKICGDVHFRRCVFHGQVTESTGVKKLIVDDCDIEGSMIVAPQQGFLRRNRIIADAGEMEGAIKSKEAWPSRILVLEDNIICHDGVTRYAINDGAEQSLTITATGPNEEIKIAGNDLATLQRLGIGSFLYAADMSNWGRITDMTYDGGDWLLAGDWKGTPAGTWHYYAVLKIRECNTKQNGEQKPVFRNSRAPQVGRQTVLGNAIPFEAGFERRHILGFTQKITARVIRPYTGPDPQAILSIYLNNGATEALYIEMDMASIGYEEVTLQGNIGATAPLAADEAAHDITVYFRQGFSGTTPLTGTEQQMPKLLITFDVIPP